MLTSSEDFSACLSNCSNQGTCVLSTNKYICDCFEDFTVDKCQVNLKPRSYYPCMNNADCIDLFDLDDKNQSVLKLNVNVPIIFMAKDVRTRSIFVKMRLAVEMVVALITQVFQRVNVLCIIAGLNVK